MPMIRWAESTEAYQRFQGRPGVLADAFKRYFDTVDMFMVTVVTFLRGRWGVGRSTTVMCLGGVGWFGGWSYIMAFMLTRVCGGGLGLVTGMGMRGGVGWGLHSFHVWWGG